MKKRLIVALVLLLVLLQLGALAQGMQHVVDQAGTFSAQEIAALDSKLNALYDKYGFDVVIVTTRDSRGKTAQLYSADFYDEFRDYDDYPNGAIFSFNFDLGDYYESTRGVGMTLFADSGASRLDSLLRPYLDDRDYYGAMQRYTDYIAETLDRASYTDESGRLILTGELRAPSLTQSLTQVARKYLIFIAIGGVIIGFLIALAMRGRLLIAKPLNTANQYSQGSVNMYDSSDIFLYDTVTRTRIQENRSSGGGGGGGGGGRFTSSSGRSYGGRGGKL